MNEAEEPPAGRETPGDAATAFDAMRRQLALLTSAVQGFAAQQDKIAARDYAPDLAQLIALQGQLVDAVQTLARRPGVALTPGTMAQQMEAAAAAARRGDHELLEEAARHLVATTHELNGMIARVRMGEQQLDSRIWAWVFGAGTVLILLILPQLLGRS